MTTEIPQRNPGPLVAIVLGLLGVGLGYVYVGRLRLAVALVIAAVVTLSVAGWSRIVLSPVGLYLIAAIGLLIGLVALVHSAFIAARSSDVPAEPYNRWWVYLLWIVGTIALTEAYAAARGPVFGFENLRVPSSSMAPTLVRGDYVVADTWAYRSSSPEFGDIVIYRSLQTQGFLFAQRVVGLPGDAIEIKGDVLYRNGEAIDEPYIQLTRGQPSGLDELAPTVVPANSYFVLGDNRHNARDSRFTGPVASEDIHGRLVHRWFSFDDRIAWERFPEKIERLEQTD